MDKVKFLKEEYIRILQQIPADHKGEWGVLTAQGMVEHMTDSVGVAWGRIQDPLQTPPQYLEKVRNFALSDIPFKPGTKNSLMSEAAAPLRNANMKEAIEELQHELDNFFAYWAKQSEGHTVLNPSFGEFNFNEWVHLLHKHAFHHLKQFRVGEKAGA